MEYKVTKIDENGNSHLCCTFINNYGAFENAVTLNMQLHNVGSIWDAKLRHKYAEGVWLPRIGKPKRDRAYVNHGTDVYCVMEAR